MIESKICDVDRKELYFGQWQYAVRFWLQHASFLRELDHASIDTMVQYRNSWCQTKPAHSRITLPIIDDQQQKILHKVCDFLQSRSHSFKKIVSGHSISLYTNHLADFQGLASISAGRIEKVDRAVLTLAPDVVTLTNPQHCFRTYFRDRWISQDELEDLRRYFSTRTDQFRLSPGFERVVAGHRVFLASNNFVDHNEPNADLLISMVVPGVVRKTLPIVGRAK